MVPIATNNSPKYRRAIIRNYNPFSSRERYNNNWSAEVSLQGVTISSKCKKNSSFWLLTSQHCRRKWKNCNSLFPRRTKERHFHKCTSRKTHLPREYKKASRQLFSIVVQPRVSISNSEDLGLEGFSGLFSGANDERFIFVHSNP